VADQQLWQRQLCVVDLAEGDVKDTAVDWSCPVRSADKDDFLLQDDVDV
jgi:hypothetical protein